MRKGIPQGLPISPILYLFYKADLLTHVKDQDLKRAARDLWTTPAF